jgi:hypothetical protein
MEPVTEEEYQEAIALATTTLQWVEQELQHKQKPPDGINS